MNTGNFVRYWVKRMDDKALTEALKRLPDGQELPWFDGKTEHRAVLRREVFVEDMRRNVRSRIIDLGTLLTNKGCLLNPRAVFQGTEREFTEIGEPHWQVGDEGIAIVTDIRKTQKLQSDGGGTLLAHPPSVTSVFVVWVLPTGRDLVLMRNWKESFGLAETPDSKVIMFGWDESDQDDLTLPNGYAGRYKTTLYDREAS